MDFQGVHGYSYFILDISLIPNQTDLENNIYLLEN